MSDRGVETVKISVSAWLHRLTSYLRRVPLLTRAVLVAVPIVHLLGLCGLPLAGMWRLDPVVMNLTQMHRLNTYPLVHTGWIHALLNVIAVTPLLERFEREVGTLKTTLLIAGPLVTLPAVLYLGIEMFVLRGREAVMGASALVFTFLAIESVKTSGFQPNYTVVGWEIPTWSTPIIWMVLAGFLWPGSNVLGHFCGLIIGYAFACRYLRLLEPSEWILKKVEEKLGFLLFRLPWYVNLEKRSELNYMEMLPAVGGGPRTGEASSSGSSGGFNAPGRPLGSV